VSLVSCLTNPPPCLWRVAGWPAGPQATPSILSPSTLALARALRRHAVFPMGFLLCAPLAGLPESGLPAMRGAVATVLLRLPVIKQMLGALGCYPAGARPRRPVGAGLVTTILSYSLPATSASTPCDSRHSVWHIVVGSRCRVMRPRRMPPWRVGAHRQAEQPALTAWVGV